MWAAAAAEAAAMAKAARRGSGGSADQLMAQMRENLVRELKSVQRSASLRVRSSAPGTARFELRGQAGLGGVW